jgi:hypothetical protein
MEQLKLQEQLREEWLEEQSVSSRHIVLVVL